MKAPDQRHIVRFTPWAIDIDDCDLCREGRNALQNGVDLRGTEGYVKLGALP